MKVLVVDDDPKIAAYLQKLLEKMECEPVIASTGKEAMQVFENEPADVVLLDLFLPDARGDQLIPGFRKRWPDVQVITMTGYNSDELERTVRSIGVVYYMIKPFEVENLKLLIGHMKTRYRKGGNNAG